MARAALGWGVRELAARADVAPNTITRLENGADVHGATLRKVGVALEAEGIRFGTEEDGSVWVRLRPKARDD